ncbi:MAG TPA: hypothetical protein VMP68_22965 [Candidatus Eisenbacteria bacterium]|nr:hypothetical protein [Candidatus Eisenbacteria bacterium]
MRGYHFYGELQEDRRFEEKMMAVPEWAPNAAKTPMRMMTPILVLLLMYLSSSAYGQTCVATGNSLVSSGAQTRSDLPPIKMIAFGTSVTWGNGLREDNTFRHIVANWVSAQTNRSVQLYTFAHSSALLVNQPAEPPTEPNPDPGAGDLDYSVPSVDQQIDCASSMPDSATTDLILMEGCINDVGAERIVYPWTQTAELRDRTDQKCGCPMGKELRKVGERFPAAVVIVVGYYPIISDRSSLFGFSSTRGAAKRAIKTYTNKHPEALQQSKHRLPRHQEHGRMATNSEEFYQHAKAALKEAVSQANGANPPRFFFAGLPEASIGGRLPTVDPLFAYGAPQRHQWMLPIRFLHFWAFHKDQKFWYRQKLCDQYFNRPLAIVDRTVCEDNSAFHPNLAGERLYAWSIEAVVPATVIDGWRLRFAASAPKRTASTLRDPSGH